MAVTTLVSIPALKRGSGYRPIPGIGGDPSQFLGVDLTPLVSFLIYESEPGRIRYPFGRSEGFW